MKNFAREVNFFFFPVISIFCDLLLRFFFGKICFIYFSVKKKLFYFVVLFFYYLLGFGFVTFLCEADAEKAVAGTYVRTLLLFITLNKHFFSKNN